MKRTVYFLLALVLIVAMCPGVNADVIYIPEDDFLEDHMAWCTRVNRGFYTRTEVTIYKSPESNKVICTLPSDKLIGILYTWTDGLGNEWGYTEDYETDAFGWLPMAYLRLHYDYISFEEDYGDLFRHCEDWIQIDPALAGQQICFWEYPGSESGNFFQLDQDPENLPHYGTVYTDSNGRDWGYINYHMGFRNVWICLSAPNANFETLYPNGAPEVEITEPDETLPPLPEQEIKPGFTPVRMIVGAGVIACVVVTAIVIMKMKKKQ